MVICEGPDGAGKSTLVAHLAQRFGFEVGERGVADRDFLYKVTRMDTYRAMATAIEGKSPPKVWDRLFVSEFVYHSIQPGRPCEFNLFETGFIRRVLNSIGCPVIACLPPFEVVQQNSAAVHQMKGVNESLEFIYAKYAHENLPWPGNTLWYDYTGQTEHFASLEEVEEEISGYLQARKEREAWDSVTA